MRKVLAVAVLLCSLTFVASAQIAPSPSTVFTVTAGMASASGQNNQGAYLTGLLPLSPSLAVRADTVLLTSPQVTLATLGLEYIKPLSALGIFKNSTYPAVKNASLFGHFGLGEGFYTNPTDASQSKAKFAAEFGGGLQINLNSTMFIRPVDLTYVYSPIGGTGFRSFGNQAVFQAAVGFIVHGGQ